MRGRDVIVVGGGIIGICSAYELASRGYRTTLLERREGLALETTYANGALLTSSMSDPWNAPGVHRHLAASLFARRAAMRLRIAGIPTLLGWGLRFLASSNGASHRQATRANFILGRYSVGRTRELRESLALEYDAAFAGTLKVFRDERAMAAPLALAKQLASLGLRFEIMQRDAAIAAEPALQDIAEQIVGALRFPDDGSGDAYRFSAALSQALLREGGRIEKGTRVVEILSHRGDVSGVRTEGGRIEAGVVIVAAGNSTPKLLRRFGIRLPIAPAKGYTVTFDTSHIQGLPSVPVIDDSLHAAIVPLGSRLRVAGTVEFAGTDLRIRPEGIANLTELLARVYPRIAAQLDLASGQPWAGLRPMSADGLPFIGATTVRGLYVNGGHGHLGWTLASGSAQLLADLIAGDPPRIDPGPYRTER